MRLALEQAERAAEHDDVPIGAVVARGEEVLGAAGNERELRRDPTAHAEVLALRQAAEALGGWRLPETTIYVTLEPCAMCAGAISLARVPRLVYGAADPKGGAAGGVIDLYRRTRLGGAQPQARGRGRALVRGVQSAARGFLRRAGGSRHTIRAVSEIDRAWLRELMSPRAGAASARRTRARSRSSSARAARCWTACPMNWMVRWPGEFPVYVDEAHGARFTDVDGHEYVDLCLGDTGAMAGHSPEPVVRTVSERAAKGITTMLPNEDAGWVGEELGRRFGLPLWQFSLTATDANRWAIRLCAPDHRPAEDPGPELVLPRQRRRDLHPARRRREDGPAPARATSGRRWTRPRRPAWSRSTTPRRSSASWPTATSPACWSSRR